MYTCKENTYVQTYIIIQLVAFSSFQSNVLCFLPHPLRQFPHGFSHVFPRNDTAGVVSEPLVALCAERRGVCPAPCVAQLGGTRFDVTRR